MQKAIGYILAGVGLATGFVAVLHSWQFNRSMKRAFVLTSEDLP